MATSPDFGTLGLLQIRLGMQNATDDDLQELKTFMAPTTAMMIDFMNRDPRVTRYVEKVDGQGLPSLSVRHYPLVSVDQVVVTIGPNATVTLTPDSDFTFGDYLVERLNGEMFPRGRRNVVVSYTAGDDSKKAQLQEAWVQAVKAAWIAKDVDPNATGESWAGVSTAQWQPQGPGYLPANCRSMLAPMVHPGWVS